MGNWVCCDRNEHPENVGKNGQIFIVGRGARWLVSTTYQNGRRKDLEGGASFFPPDVLSWVWLAIIYSIRMIQLAKRGIQVSKFYVLVY